MVALALVQREKLALDEDVNAKLKSWTVPEGPATQSRKVTLRRLLSHTAGISHHSLGSYAFGAEIPTAVQILNGAKPAVNSPVRVIASPGSMWKYSGGGFVIIQQLVCDVTGMSFAEAAASLVLDPAGMRDSVFDQPLPDSQWPRAALGHLEGVALHGGDPIVPALAAGGLWTTAADLERFFRALFNALDGVQGAILSQALAREMLTPRHPSSYGLGFMLLDRPSPASTFGHSGNNRGFESFAVGDVRNRRITVVLANRDTRSQFPRAVFAEIHRSKEGHPVEFSGDAPAE
jgi:CubicO group peptidase (beta-lactamase class C family)